MTENIILDYGESNELTVYTTKVEEIESKTIQILSVPVTTPNYANGPKTWLVDMLRIQRRFTVNGSIKTTDRTKFRKVLRDGGAFVMRYGTENFTVNMEKHSITEIGKDDEASSPDTFTVLFTVIEGVNYG